MLFRISYHFQKNKFDGGLLSREENLKQLMIQIFRLIEKQRSTRLNRRYLFKPSNCINVLLIPKGIKIIVKIKTVKVSRAVDVAIFLLYVAVLCLLYCLLIVLHYSKQFTQLLIHPLNNLHRNQST